MKNHQTGKISPQKIMESMKIVNIHVRQNLTLF